jgi:hypothetical protein
VLSSRRRSAWRTIRSSSAPLAVAAKNSPSVTPSVSAIFCKEPSDGETCPFSSCEMKLGENPVCAANARTETWRFNRSRRMCSPMICGSTGLTMLVLPTSASLLEDSTF